MGDELYKKAIDLLKKGLTEEELVKLWETMEGEEQNEFFWNLNQAVYERRPDLFVSMEDPKEPE